MSDFEVFIKRNNLKKSAIAQYIGVSNGFITQIINGSRKLPHDKLLKIIANQDWDISMFGEREMLKNAAEVATSGHRIRYWVDVDATAGGVTQFDDMMSSQYIDLAIPEFRDCTDAVNLYGDSMFPLYKSGSIIILKEWKESFIDFGNVYLIITKNGNRMVKYLRKGSDVAHVLCVSENKEFDPFEIEIGDILRLYLVKGGVHKNTL